MILGCLALPAVFTSCENDPIEIVGGETILEINTSKVMEYEGIDHLMSVTSKFGQDQIDDLMSLGGTSRLRVRCMIYNDNGKLVQQNESYGYNYLNNVSVKLMLPAGKYTAVTISDVVRVDNDNNITFRYWTLEDSTDINTARIEETGYIGKGTCLSATVNTVEVGNKSTTYSISPSPLGALMYALFDNIHSSGKYTDVELWTKKSAKNVVIRNGKVEANLESDTDYAWRLCSIDVTDWADSPSVSTVYGFYFVFPSQKTPIGWAAIDSNNKNYFMFGEKNFDFKAGDFVYAYVNMATLNDKTPGQTIISASNYKANSPVHNSEVGNVKSVNVDDIQTVGNSIKLTDINRMIYSY